MSSKSIIAITMGDPCGIGPEVVAKALAIPEITRECHPLVIGNAPLLRKTAGPGPDPGHNARVLCGAGCGQRHLHTRPGQPEAGGHCAGPDQRSGWKGLRRVGAASWGAGPVGRRAGHGHRSHKQGSGPGRRLQRHRSPGAAAEPQRGQTGCHYAHRRQPAGGAPDNPQVSGAGRGLREERQRAGKAGAYTELLPGLGILLAPHWRGRPEPSRRRRRPAGA